MEQIAHFQIRETLGFGALGTVYLAWDTKLNRTVALKVLSGEAQSDNLRQRFHLEARTIAALKHPNIVSVLDYSDSNAATQFMALECLDGHSLFSFVREHGPLPEQVALAVAREVAAALEYAHSQNVVHRDVKPDNIILENGRVVLIDFGAMRLTGDHKYIPETDVDKTPMAIGTPGFMAPEQFAGTEVDHRCDIFGLGAVLYNVTTGKLPYDTTQKSPEALFAVSGKGRYRDPRDFQPLLSPGLCVLLAHCLAPRPSHRPESAAQVREQIEALLAAHGVTDPQKVIASYLKAPSPDHDLEATSTDALTRQLKLSMMRDLHRAIRGENQEQIADAVTRLRHVQRVFDTAEQQGLLGTADKPRLLREVRVSRLRWFLVGAVTALALSASALVTALTVARPGWHKNIGQVLSRVLGR